MTTNDPFEGIDVEVDTTAPQPKKKRRGKVGKAVEDRILDAYVEELKPTPTTGTTAADDTTKERATLIFAIKAYGKSARFSKYLKEQGKQFGETRLQKMSVDQLKLELESLDLIVASRGSGDLIQTIVHNGMTFAEAIVHKRTKFKVAGTTHELFENDRFLDLLERVKLKYGMPSVQIDPALELSLVVVQTAMTVHQQNQFRDGLPTFDLDKPANADDDLLAKFERSNAAVSKQVRDSMSRRECPAAKKINTRQE